MSYEQSKIILCFCVPNQLVKKMQVTINSNVGCLLKYFKENNEDYIYIYDGNIVDYNSTFEDINFKEGKTIFALRKVNTDRSEYQTARTRSKIIELSKDLYFEKKIRVLTNRNAQSEYNKVMDIRLMKIEGSCKSFKKKLQNYNLSETNENEIQNDISLTTDYKQLSEPCSEALPFLW